jgi:alpha-L-arabinofuranosidase
MKKTGLLLCFLSIALSQLAYAGNTGNDEPDSVYLFSYATNKNSNKNGLHFAWSRDRQTWYSIGNEYGFVRSDYGPWGAEKRMISPYLLPGPDGLWHCVWSLNEQENLFAHTSSRDLVYWGRQSYPQVKEGTNCLKPVLQYDKTNGHYIITYATGNAKFYKVTTKDFKRYSAPLEISAAQYTEPGLTIVLQGNTVTGQAYLVPWSMVDKLIKTYELKQYKNSQNAEHTLQDSQRFAALKPVEATISVYAASAKPISDLLMGIFFEDINYAADGGLYAELIQNRDFEYSLSDKRGRDKNWTATHSWGLKGENTVFTIDSAAPVHVNNLHYAVLDTRQPGATLINQGFDGIVLNRGEKYNLSLLAKRIKGKNGKLRVSLVDKNEVIATTTLNLASSSWKAVNAVLTATANTTNAQLQLQPLEEGILALDMISLFPQKTFKGRKNGLRADLAQTIADIRPRFIRFPGGCVAHGDGLGNMYRWKNSIGPLESRKPQQNLWGYHQTAGLGYFEYFQFCEDIGAEPLPVIAAGVPCQNSASGPNGAGQQGGIPMDEMDEYIQEVFDLVEWANGDVSTPWGKKRAEAGHPKPFNLKYIGIGNEDLITDVFEERFTMIYRAMKQKHPEITVIGTVGPFFEGTDYVEGWDLANKLSVPMVDEHYYNSPGWFINNQDFYDKYDRSRSKVYLGEYAAHLPGRPNNLETALAEALYLASLERNGDVVTMASYAPLLAKEGHTQWNPDLIYFNNSEVKPTVGYYVQQLYGINSGNQYLPVTVSLNNNQDAVKKRIAISVVRDTKSNDVILKMVNLLPVTVVPSIDLKGLNIAKQETIKTVLTGKPADKNAKPVTSPITVSELFSTELPAYSFTVIRIRTK